MAGVFFTSDTHFGSIGMCSLRRRWNNKAPFSDMGEMDHWLVSEWNRVVPRGSRVYHLGDIGFSDGHNPPTEIFKRLNGQIYICVGNHDRSSHIKELLKLSHVVWAKDVHYLKIGEDKIMLCHYPMASWWGSFKGTYHLHGHTHTRLKSEGMRRADVGVDSFPYRPVEWGEVKRILEPNKELDI